MEDQYIFAEYADNALDLLDKNVYEPILLELLNYTFFDGNLCYRDNNHQAHGESDYYDRTNGNKYDAKLLLYCEKKGQGKLLLQSDAPMQWVKSILEEFYEIGKIRSERMIEKISDTQFYHIMSEHLGKTKYDEGCIFFFPFPIPGDYNENDGVFSQFAENGLTFTYDQLVSNGIVNKDKEVLLVSSAIGDRVVVRKLHESFMRRFVKTNAISRYMKYVWGDKNGPKD